MDFTYNSPKPMQNPYCQLNNTCSGTPKTRRLRHSMAYSYSQAPNRTYRMPLPHAIPMRNSYGKLYMSTRSQFKVTYRLLLCKSHSTCYYSCPFSNPLKFYRGSHPDNCLWTYFILTILPSKSELRVSPQPNYITHPRFSNSASTNSVLMTSSKSH